VWPQNLSGSIFTQRRAAAQQEGTEMEGIVGFDQGTSPRAGGNMRWFAWQTAKGRWFPVLFDEKPVSSVNTDHSGIDGFREIPESLRGATICEIMNHFEEIEGHHRTLVERRNWLAARIEAKRKIGWETQYDEREYRALCWAVVILERHK
jgi:hypothetical protein